MRPALRTIGLLALLACTLGGCIGIPIPHTNPAFDVPDAEIQRDYDRLKANPVALRRPIVIVNGYHAPHVLISGLRLRLIELTGARDSDVIALSYPTTFTVRGWAHKIVEGVEAAWPSDDPERTTEVDVVTLSFGGVTARAASMTCEQLSDPEPRKRLNVARMFTLASPFRSGSKAEQSGSIDDDATLLDVINEFTATNPYELVCYTRLYDEWIGATNAAPLGRNPIWVSGTIPMGHMGIVNDYRILVDLTRRIRYEEPIAKEGEAPPHN
jgi:hypothetical protein